MEFPLRLRDHDVIGNCLADRTVQILISHRGKQMQWARLGNATFKVAVRFPAAPPRVHIGALHATGSDPRRFPGTAPLSEPETRWINDEMEHFRPQVIISVHAPYGVLDFDGPAPTPHQFGRLIFNRVGVYPGSLGNYSGVHKNVPVITIELPNATTMPSDAEVRRIWLDMLKWIQRNVPRGEVVSAHAGNATPAHAIGPVAPTLH